jgi:AraC-like DNA-binding protein
LGAKPAAEHKPLSGTNLLKRADLKLRAVKVQDDLQHKKMRKNVQKIRKVFHSNRRLTFHEVAEEAGISKTTCHEILTEHLGTNRVAEKFLPGG